MTEILFQVNVTVFEIKDFLTPFTDKTTRFLKSSFFKIQFCCDFQHMLLDYGSWMVMLHLTPFTKSEKQMHLQSLFKSFPHFFFQFIALFQKTGV